jgi:hypothetical protein
VDPRAVMRLFALDPCSRDFTCCCLGLFALDPCWRDFTCCLVRLPARLGTCADVGMPVIARPARPDLRFMVVIALLLCDDLV